MITSLTLVKNEERFVWYSLSSVIPYVDRAIVWDSGSTDNTRKILFEVKRKYGRKVDLEFLDNFKIEDYSAVYQKMLERIGTKWFMVLDGDEIWWDQTISDFCSFIKKRGDNFESVVVPTINLVGDIFHFQEEAAGKYNLAGKTGHYNLRGVNKEIPGLYADNPHGYFGWKDKSGRLIQDRNPKRIKYLNCPYLHATFLRRSSSFEKDKLVSKRKKKRKYEIGLSLPRDYYYPEVFFREKPKIVECPWEKMDRGFYIRAFFETPLRKIKRRILPDRVGY